MSKAGFVYLLTDKGNGTLYTGVTSTLKNVFICIKPTNILAFLTDIRQKCWFILNTIMVSRMHYNEKKELKHGVEAGR